MEPVEQAPHRGLSLPMILAVVFSSIGIVICGLAVFVLRRRWSKRIIVTRTEVIAGNNDPNVVVGRPVGPANTNMQVTSVGAPVSTVPANGDNHSVPAKVVS